MLFLLAFVAVMILVAVFMVLMTKNIYSRMLFIGFSINLLVLAIVILGSDSNNVGYLDIALIYLFLSFIAMKGFLKYFLKS